MRSALHHAEDTLSVLVQQAIVTGDVAGTTREQMIGNNVLYCCSGTE